MRAIAFFERFIISKNDYLFHGSISLPLGDGTKSAGHRDHRNPSAHSAYNTIVAAGPRHFYRQRRK